MQMQMYQPQHTQWGHAGVTSRERMALPPITLAATSTTPRNGELPTSHYQTAYAHSTPVMMMLPPGHRPMMLSPSGMAISPAFARSPLASCSPSISKKRIRVIPNATKSITLDLLRPHFDRPLAEVAAMFGICMTLMKKICRKNGVPRWPHRQIRGLRKSIWSIEKALRSCESEAQRRSYVEHLDKQKEKLEAILRGPEGPGKSIFHELVMSVPCSPMSELVTPKASDAAREAASPVGTPSSRLALDMPVSSPAPQTSPTVRPAFAPSPHTATTSGACQTPTISRLPSIASLLAAHAAKATPTHTFQC